MWQEAFKIHLLSSKCAISCVCAIVQYLYISRHGTSIHGYQVRCALRNVTESNFLYFLCVKSKETYYARCQELDKSKKDGSSPKEIEKASPSDTILLIVHSGLQRACSSIIIVAEFAWVLVNVFSPVSFVFFFLENIHVF